MIDSGWRCDLDGLIELNAFPSFQWCWEEVISDPQWKIVDSST